MELQEVKDQTVYYQNLKATVKANDLREALIALGGRDAHLLNETLKSVLDALEAISKKVEKGEELTKKEKRNAANDMAIWLAIQMIQGNAHRYKESVRVLKK